MVALTQSKFWTNIKAHFEVLRALECCVNEGRLETLRYHTLGTAQSNVVMITTIALHLQVFFLQTIL